MDSLHLQCYADVLLSNGREESRIMDHPVHVLIDHDRVEVLQVAYLEWGGGGGGEMCERGKEREGTWVRVEEGDICKGGGEGGHVGEGRGRGHM